MVFIEGIPSRPAQGDKLMRNRHTVVAALTGLTLLMPAAHLTNAYAVDDAQANDAQGQNASTSAYNAPQANKAGVAAPLTQSDVDDAQKNCTRKAASSARC